MGQKVHPTGFRLAVTRDWDSRWYASKQEFPGFIKEDYEIRKFLTSKLRYASVPRIFIERASGRIRVKIFTARPGVVIGRKGAELDKLKDGLNKVVKKEIMLDIQEVKRPDLSAQLVAENVALQLERRIAFRRAMKRAVQTTMAMGAEGIRIQCGGRLGGADIARTERQHQGKVPLQTLRANINYGFSEANTVYGIIGVKCWICLPEEGEA
ncbi:MULTISPECIES: 30S ribosomal protein S3 [unclassified Lentimonas]|jgi:small subunit ribosomal protein S3|uniref:30S ribosomal protein S3 n=1 Tax=unclassified Lentimonas TaxID=2630993 RepID=UPI0013265DA0|nr:MULTISPECIES: 30S ribosomal protein S3 [unclassified Lentimonas]CAA6677484.1 SSU ribosomal protein S3p (S3e) [Lentimonas sp. CC4]CAA6686454.1 SSU ribosomal protein S3p (S3e) [Lentimonas sp. CC6]CAA6690260.1 SSU ribosomal protein S3p (S3e) [Lentimonas sp. CC19]CAA6690814.1 SSU ribosomal protein S3p (S3e) [Lentimonas sp. CC10]CAA7068523.1 SSU ribosomal protein S3p (S3e) [Lentimonas sp. CC11]